MANKTKKSSDSPATKVTRIKATDAAPVTKKPKTDRSSAAEAKTSKQKTGTKQPSAKKSNIFRAIGEYFKGAWYELGQVRWPTRRATWGLTFAVLAYTAFFVTIIILLDLGFNKLLQAFIG